MILRIEGRFVSIKLAQFSAFDHVQKAFSRLIISPFSKYISLKIYPLLLNIIGYITFVSFMQSKALLKKYSDLSRYKIFPKYLYNSKYPAPRFDKIPGSIRI